VSELLVADEIVAQEEEQELSPFPVNKDTSASVDLEFTDQTWMPDSVHTSPEVADVIAKLPWWAVRSLLYVIIAFILVAFTWASIVKVDMVAVANGTVIPQGNIKPIQPASSGVVQNVFVKEGDSVGVGDALIQLDAAEMRTRLFKLRQELEASQSQLRLMMVNRPINETLEQRNRIARLQGEISDVERMFRHTTITSPVKGIITTINVRGPGEVLRQGQTVATIAPSDVPLVVETLLADKDIAFVQKGLAAKLKFEAFPFQDYGVVEGTVIDVSPDATNKDGINYYKVTIAPSKTLISTRDKDVVLRPGLSVSAEIITERRTVLSLILEPVRKFKSDIALSR
jgi:multidrug efflux pump subunit AcrA (membrane-fusion protein)